MPTKFQAIVKHTVYSVIFVGALTGCDDKTNNNGSNGSNIPPNPDVGVQITQTGANAQTVTLTNNGSVNVNSLAVTSLPASVTENTADSTCEQVTFPLVSGNSCTYVFNGLNTLSPGVIHGAISLTANFAQGGAQPINLSSTTTTYLYESSNTATNSVHRWDGSSWTLVGSTSDIPPSVVSLAADKEGNIYTGTVSGGGVSEWNGSTWTTLSGITNIQAVLVNSNDNLYAGQPGGVNGVYLWGGSSWSAVTGGATPLSATALAGDSLGNIYAGLSNPGSNAVEEWNGSTWVQLIGGSTPGSSDTLAVDHANRLYSASLANGSLPVSVWDGNTWTQLTGGATPLGATSLAVDSSNNIYAGLLAGSNAVCEWNGSTWTALTAGTAPILVYSLTTDANNNLYAGRFNGGVYMWDGSTWIALTGGDTITAALSLVLASQLTISN